MLLPTLHNRRWQNPNYCPKSGSDFLQCPQAGRGEVFDKINLHLQAQIRYINILFLSLNYGSNVVHDVPPSPRRSFSEVGINKS